MSGTLVDRLDVESALCPSCDARSSFQYLGFQEVMLLEAPSFPLPLYNCSVCKSTVSYVSLYLKNEEVK